MSSSTPDAYSPPLLTPRAAARAIPRWVFTDVLFPFVYTRLLLICVGWYAVAYLPTARAVGWEGPTNCTALNLACHFDAGWYLSISLDGYHFRPGTQCNIAFSPLLPMLMRCGGACFGGSATGQLLAGVLIANLALLAGLIYLFLLLRLDGHDAAVASRTIWYLLIFPTTLFFSAVYPMSLFLALAVAAFYHARNRQWPLAAALAALGALTRPDGVLLSTALALEYLQQRQFAPRRIRPDFLWLGLGPLALAGWMACQWRWFGNPLAFVAVQHAWKPWSYGAVLCSPQAPLQISCAVWFVLLTASSFRHVRFSYAVFGALMLSVMLLADRYWSITRFVLVLFPAFIALAILGRRYRIVHYVYTFLATPLATYLMVRFALNQWVA